MPIVVQIHVPPPDQSLIHPSEWYRLCVPLAKAILIIRRISRRKSTERFCISEFTNASGNTSWRVSGTRPDGTRVRQNFANKAEALQAQSQEEGDAAGLPDHLNSRSRSINLR